MGQSRTCPACHDQAGKGAFVRYLIVAEAYSDLEQVSSRLGSAAITYI
ncbi:MAG TPA: hypothetical protein VMA73_21655 [Streptosporangiaceae bacterium]|nr:hypothetical protein [Streptosporangiaceae bacterium]